LPGTKAGGQTSGVLHLPLLDDTELFRRLVAFDSVSRNSNLPLADFIAEYLDRPGVRLARNASADDAKVNLIVTAGPDPGGERRGLTLSGHTDVVPADEPEWESDPFTLTRRGDSLYGRGAADMKGFVALAVNRVAQCDPARLRHPVALLLTYDEELGTLGAQRFAETWDRPETLPRHTLIGEPTSLRAVRMHKGHLKLVLSVDGVSAHSGYPHLGHNAIEPAARAILALAGLRAELERERSSASAHFPEVPFVTLTVTMIHGGAAINVLPDRCEVSIGSRILPDMSSESIVERIRAAVAPPLEGERWQLDLAGDSPPFRFDAEHPLHRELCEAVGQHDSRSVGFATDAGWLQRVGFDCVIWGPGTIEVAHKPNESLPLAEFHQAGTLLDRLIDRHCLGQKA